MPDKKKITPLEDIRVQAEPEIITIPGFRPATTINVQIRYVDLTPAILSTNISNPLLALAYQRAREGKTEAEIAAEINSKHPTPEKDAEQVLQALNVLAKQALVSPTYDELTAIAPLNAEQLAAIYLYMLYGERGEGLSTFRTERGV
jgi:hypothetical protein